MFNNNPTNAAHDKFLELCRKKGLIFHVNHLPADDSHEKLSLFGLQKKQQTFEMSRIVIISLSLSQNN